MTTLATTSRPLGRAALTTQGELTAREKLFVSYYLQSLHGADAAKRAGFAGNHYAVSHRLLNDPRIKPVIEAGYGQLAPTPREIIGRISAQARATIADVFDIDDAGTPRLNLKKAEEAGRLGVIRSLRYDANDRPIVEMCDSQAALLHLAKILGLLVDTHLFASADGGAVQVQQVRESVALLLTNPDTMTQAMDLAEKLTQNDINSITINGAVSVPAPGPISSPIGQ